MPKEKEMRKLRDLGEHEGAILLEEVEYGDSDSGRRKAYDRQRVFITKEELRKLAKKYLEKENG